MGHVVRQATLPHETNDEKKQLPTHETVGDVQHAPLCSHRLRSTSTNTNRYTRCCAVDMETAGGARVARSVTSHYHRTSQKKQKNKPTKKMVVHVQHAPLCPHTLRSTPTNTKKYTRCCDVDAKAGGGGHGTHVVRQATYPHLKNKFKNSPPRTQLSPHSMRPCAHTHSAPPRQIQINTHAAALSIQRREEAGMGHTRCENRISLTK